MPPVSCGAGHSVTYISRLAAREQEIHRADTRNVGTASTVHSLSLRRRQTPCLGVVITDKSDRMFPELPVGDDAAETADMGCENLVPQQQ